jgi:hypothetical protein
MIDGKDYQLLALALTSGLNEEAFEWLTGCKDQNKVSWDPPENVVSEVETWSLRISMCSIYARS